MTDEELQQLVERDNLARVTVMMLEHVAEIAAKQPRKLPPELDDTMRARVAQSEEARRARVEQLMPEIHGRIANYDRLAREHGAKPLQKRAKKVKGEPENLPSDLLNAYRGLKQRIADVEHITLAPTPVLRGADIPDAP